MQTMNSNYNHVNQQQQWNGSNNNNSNTPCNVARTMTDRIHAEVKSMVSNSRLVRRSEGIALVHRRDVEIGELLGRGAFSEVHEVRVRNLPPPPQTTTGENDDATNGNGRYAMKHLKAKLLTQPDNFRLAAAELAVEAHMLASFDHPNVMKIRGWATNGVASFADGRHDSFFLLLDRLDETLDQRIASWTKQQQQNCGHLSHHHQQQQPSGLLAGSLVSDLWRRLSIAPTTNDDYSLQQHQQQHASSSLTVHQQQQQQHAAESLYLEKLGVCVEIASALAYLHSKCVIFRDLKPNNIGFLNGRVQLFDFGLSRELPSVNLEEPFEMSGKVGTLRYMAVEVASHQVYNVSADVYSWAMVCYEIFTLEKPFNGWTRDMHANLVCGRGARPETNALPPAVRSILEVSWSQYAYRRPTMRAVEQKMKDLEEQQLLVVCSSSPPQVVVETPSHFPTTTHHPDYVTCTSTNPGGVRKMPHRSYSDAHTASTVSVSTESLGSYMYR